MTDQPPYPDSSSDTSDDTGVRPDHESTTSTPRWVKVFGIILAVVVLLFVIMLFTKGPGGRGPGHHAPPEGGHR